MDPAIGASTWALGSHKCTVNRGSLTMKARIAVVHHRAGVIIVGGDSGVSMFSWRFEWYIRVRLASSGSLAAII